MDFKSLVKHKKTLRIVFFWWLSLMVIAIIAMKVLPFRPTFPYWDTILSKLSPYQFIWHWANFDGPHYLTIANEGYLKTNYIQAYFPLYPVLTGILGKIFSNTLAAGLVISYTSFILAVIVFKKIIRLEKLDKLKISPFIFLLLFPTSFYFISLYSESLFLLLSLLSFLYMLRKKWFLSAIFISLASGTRLVGIFIVPALLWEYFKSQPKKEKKNKKVLVKAAFLSIVSILGFVIYSLYLNNHFDDPFYFASVQNAFGASRQTDKLILLYQVVWRYIKMILTMDRTSLMFYTIVQEFVLSIFALFVLLWGVIKKVRTSFLIYGFLSFILPTLTGNFSSMPRYLALIFPIYFILARIKSKKLKLFILSLSSILLVVNTALFLRGVWIS
ncbi:hypothetical protein ACFLZ1_04450 [Patescibacteria group bacterium]